MFGLGQDLVKGGKMVTAAMALRAACSGMGKYKITNTAFSDFTAALTRAIADRLGPGQAFARATIEVADRLAARGYTILPRRTPITPVIRGVEGNEVADSCAKAAAEDKCDSRTGSSYNRRPSPTWHEQRPKQGAREREPGLAAASRAAGGTGC